MPTFVKAFLDVCAQLLHLEGDLRDEARIHNTWGGGEATGLRQEGVGGKGWLKSMHTET
jgi:hypothetical protein